MARVIHPYSQARFRPIGHEVHKRRKTRQSSKISCDQNCLKYPHNVVTQPSHYMNGNNSHWDHNETINVRQSVKSEKYAIGSGNSNKDEDELIEGRDYDVILVYVVNPDIYDVPSDDEAEIMYCDTKESRQFPASTSDTSDAEDQEKIEKIKRYLMEDNGCTDSDVMNTPMSIEDLDLIDSVLDTTYNTPT